MPPDYARHKHGEPHAKTFKDITLGRLDRFEGYLSPALVEDRSNASDVIAMSVWHAPKLSKPSFDEAVKARHWSPLKIGDSFAPAWSNHWVKVTIKVPSEWKAYERVQLEFDPT
jgi:alpha-mannosidase